MSTGRRFSYAAATPPPSSIQKVPVTLPRKKANSNFFVEMGESDKALFGIIGVGIIVAIIIDAIAHTKHQVPLAAGLDRLQINGRIYVPLP